MNLKFLAIFAFSWLVATAGLATIASADINTRQVRGMGLHPSHEYLHQENYRQITATDGRRYETAWVFWLRPDGSTYKRYTWCDLNTRRCAARAGVENVRGGYNTYPREPREDRRTSPSRNNSELDCRDVERFGNDIEEGLGSGLALLGSLSGKCN